ncbi:MAG: type II toxin-antitoxin system HicB family antitoxin [Candidatus Margulisiibacteriota bacterium]|nr:type II toxin-antitoxin system HicB family antitoxin [bacterium]
MSKYSFPVLIEQDEDGMYIATVPDLQGCHTQARSIEKLFPRIKEAIDLCLGVEKKRQGHLPKMKFIGVQQVEVPA